MKFSQKGSRNYLLFVKINSSYESSILEHNGSMSLGCSATAEIQPLGCRPESKITDDSIAILEDNGEALDSNIGGLQLTTSAVAKFVIVVLMDAMMEIQMVSRLLAVVTL